MDKLSGLRDEEAVVAWFYRVQRNAVDRPAAPLLDLVEGARGLRGRARDDGAGTETRRAVCQCAKALADTLKPELAEALRRIENDGIAVKDYAAEAGITSNNAGVRSFARATRCASRASARAAPARRTAASTAPAAPEAPLRDGPRRRLRPFIAHFRGATRATSTCALICAHDGPTREGGTWLMGTSTSIRRGCARRCRG
jgi:hypothetical protein